jgi:hypothetical protein
LAGRLSSYRFRRRLLWSGAFVAAVAIGVTVSVLFWNTGPLRNETFSGGKATLYVPPKTAKLTADDRAEIVSVARRFMTTAVKRDDPGKAFELAGPSLRTGTTKAHWETGEIPVVPYPVDDARWRFDYTYVDEVGLEVYAWPEPDAGLRPMLFMVSMVAVGKGERRHWVVDAFVPRGGRPDVLMQRETGGSPFAAAGPPERAASKTSAAWLLILPGVLVAVLVGLPVALIAKNRRIERRAARS